MNRIGLYTFLTLTIFTVFLVSCTNDASKRQTVRLDGEWQIVKTAGEIPDVFTSVVPVPGLVDLAVPPLDTVGTVNPDGWYWYKRSFDLTNTNFEKVELKIFKAQYHTKVYVNGRFVGENYYCFTPSYFDIKPFLSQEGKTNEIVIGVGCKAQFPDTIHDGHDYDRVQYSPGVYDHVEITLSDKPYIRNIQCVPDIENEKLRVVAEIETDSPDALNLTYSISEAASGKKTIPGKIAPKITSEGDIAIADFEIDMKAAKLWSPESPFLYELKLSTGADDKRVKFGMRSFRFDTEKKIALLNGKPYYLRGTNSAVFRFFDDPDRGNLPWDDRWVIKLHDLYKDMHWNSQRFHVSFAPERWYEICDSIGILVQDEYPFWRVKVTVKAPQFAEEYKRWMRERWNHPSLVIWDAQNESITPETGLAIREVRDLDLSDRPWDNGWSEPVSETDVCETHPYLYGIYKVEQDAEPEEGYKKEFYGTVRSPGLYWAGDKSKSAKETGATFDNPMLINEYGWLWLHRDGTPTVLSERIYDILWDAKKLTPEQRFEIYARQLAMTTEYWRAHRGASGVLHFCALSGSRPNTNGLASDHWADVQTLTFDPSFYKYVRPAFSPVGIMVDIWEKEYARGAKLNIPVYVTNDLEQTFSQEIQLNILLDGQMVQTYKKEVTAGPYEAITTSFEVTLPDAPGAYQMRGELTFNGETVFSLRDIPVK